jgi:hypothetical protein
VRARREQKKTERVREGGGFIILLYSQLRIRVHGTPLGAWEYDPGGDQDRTGGHDGTVEACEALPWSVQCGDRSPCPRQDKNLKSSATWLLVPYKTFSSCPAWEGPEKGGVKAPHRSNLTTEGSRVRAVYSKWSVASSK